MTREEAIDLLDNLKGVFEDNQGNDYDAALRMAIKALQEPDPDVGRMILLLEQCLKLFKRQEESPYILNLLSETLHYDDVECDGYCLMEDIEDVLADMRGEEE